MKKILSIVFLASALLLASCGGNSDSSSNSSNSSNNYSKAKITLPESTCDVISAEFVSQTFGVPVDELEEGWSARDLDWGIDITDCGYTWKKDNYDEVLSEMLTTISKVTRGDLKDDGTPYRFQDVVYPDNKILVGRIKTYDSTDAAQNWFKNSHRSLSEEEKDFLNEWLGEELEEQGLSDEQVEIGEEIGWLLWGLDLAFIPVDGIGDMASFDTLERSLDVLYGTVSIDVYIDIEWLSQEEMIEKAKEVSRHAWDQISK